MAATEEDEEGEKTQANSVTVHRRYCITTNRKKKKGVGGSFQVLKHSYKTYSTSPSLVFSLFSPSQ